MYHEVFGQVGCPNTQGCPRRVFASEATGPPQSWFHLDRVRIERARLPPASATGLAFEWPQVGSEFFGRLETPIPLAVDATVWSDRNSKPLLSLTIVWLQLPHSLPTLADGTEDGIASGRIDLAPSRSVAPAIGGPDRYFGENVSIPVSSLEVMTVAGEWVRKEGCRQH